MDGIDIGARVEEVRDEVVDWRRRFHRNPELGFEEEDTSGFVHEILESFGGLEISRHAKTGVVARLVGEGGPGGGHVVALRADMDALPITEETGLPFASRNQGIMHACGHDGHTAYLLGAAKVLSGMRGEIAGEVRFVFQPAEEGLGGAESILEEGVLNGVDVVLGTHLTTRLPVGEVGVAYGSSSASVDTFEIEVEGEGGHAARPHLVVDPIAVAAQIVTNLQHVVSRETDPLESAVVSITTIHGGETTNVIARSVTMTGTARALSDETRRALPGKMERTAKGIAAAHGAYCSFEYHHGPAPVVTDEASQAVVEETLREAFGQESVARMPPTMGGEDFSAYRKAAPSAFVMVGAGNEEQGKTYPNHHPRFDIDEDALPVGAEVFVRCALKLLENHDGK